MATGQPARALVGHTSVWARRVAAVLGTAVLSAAVLLSAPAAATPAAPTEQEVERSRRTAQQRADEAANVEQRLDGLTAELHELEIAAGEATEAFNVAREVLVQAEAEEAAAKGAAESAEQRAEAARVHLGRLAAATYRTGGELATVNLIFDAGTERALFDGVAVMRQITGSYDIVYVAFQAARHQAAAAAVRARESTRAKLEAAENAERRRAVAERTASTGQQRVAAVEAERDALLAQLAAARATTVELERARQEALQREAEDRARKEAEERSRKDAEEHSRKEAEERARADAAAAETRTEAPAPAMTTAAEPTHTSAKPTVTRTEAATQASGAATSPPPAPKVSAAPTPKASAAPAPQTVAPRPTPKPTLTQSGGGRYTSSGAERAVAFVRAQLGKPYVYGGAGPDSFDCSGLTLRAWEAGGVRTLTHSARAQYKATSKVAYADLRPGDLVFWSREAGDPTTIYHVGMYIGAGRMIHAPNPSRPVEERSVFYMGSPIGYGRV